MGASNPNRALAPLQADAEKRFGQMALPKPRDEYWRYTSPDALTAENPVPVVSPEPAERGVLESGVLENSTKLVFVAGHLDLARSTQLELSGVTIEPLTAIAENHWAKAFYGSLEKTGQTPVPRPLAALNSATASDGLAITIHETPPTPIEIIYEASAAHNDVRLHHCIRVLSGSATVIESGIGGARFNSVMEIDIADGAEFHHLRIQPPTQSAIATHIFAELGEKSQFRSFSLAEGAKLTRNEAVLTLKKDNSAAHIGGATLGSGASHHDDTVFVTHEGVDCESRQVFKKVLSDGAVGVFQGKILIREGAQKTDGYQLSKSLLLDEKSQFLAKPELEIYADDVACSHGSTTGGIDETALFYLRARGIPQNDAKNMLVLSFLAETITEIIDVNLQNYVLQRIEKILNIQQNV